MTRIILYTGKGGVGKTSMAAATAVGLANSGKSTLIISTDPAHSLGDALNMDVGPRVKTVFKNLDAQEVSVVEAISSHWGELKVYLAALFQSQGLDPVSAEEIATLPGFDEASHLLYLNDYLKSNRYDVIVMDSAPTGEALKLLSFPEAMSWYMEKVFPIGRTTARIVRPFMKPIIGMPLPDDTVFASMDSLYKNLKKVREVLIDNSITSIRLVCNPDRMSFNETKRAYTYLLLYGYPVDALIVNKIFADNVGDFFLKWKENQREIIKEIDESFREIKVLKGLKETRESQEKKGTKERREIQEYRGLKEIKVIKEFRGLKETKVIQVLRDKKETKVILETHLSSYLFPIFKLRKDKHNR